MIPSRVILDAERIGDVVRLRMSSFGSRAVGMNVSAYVIRGIMIDSGFHRAQRELLAAARSYNVRGAILTHWHEDHAGNAQALAAAGFPIFVRDDTRSILRTHPQIRLYRRLCWGRPPAFNGQIDAFDIDGLSCIHTPGHSTDHQVVWDEATRTLFSGDLWLGVHARIFHAAEDPYRIVESLRVVRRLEPERMFDAHRGVVQNPRAAIDAKIDWLSEMLEIIEQRLREGRSESEILRLLGGEELAGYVSSGEYSRRNLIRAVRRRLESSPDADRAGPA